MCRPRETTVFQRACTCFFSRKYWRGGRVPPGTPAGESSPTVDIPTDWDPQANQQPTGLLVALPLTHQSRLVLVPLVTLPNKKIRRCKTSADFLVGCPVGLEPTVSRSTIWRVNRLRYGHHINAPEGTRTPGPLLRRQLLYPAELLAQIWSR